MQFVNIPNLYFPDPDDTVVPVVVCEELTDDEARDYADMLTADEARARLNELLQQTSD